MAKEEPIGGGGFVAQTLATGGIIMGAKTNEIATRAKPGNRDNFRIPFVMADTSSSKASARRRIPVAPH